MNEGLESGAIGRETGNAEQARLETVQANFSRLTDADPHGLDLHRRREWFTEVIGNVEILAQVTPDQTVAGELRGEASDLRLQVAALTDGRANDEVAWDTLISNAKDLMHRAVAGPESDEAAA